MGSALIPNKAISTAEGVSLSVGLAAARIEQPAQRVLGNSILTSAWCGAYVCAKKRH